MNLLTAFLILTGIILMISLVMSLILTLVIFKKTKNKKDSLELCTYSNRKNRNNRT